MVGEDKNNRTPKNKTNKKKQKHFLADKTFWDFSIKLLQLNDLPESFETFFHDVIS